MGSSAKHRKSGTPDKLKRTPSVAKKLKEFFKRKGIDDEPIKPLDIRNKKKGD